MPSKILLVFALAAFTVSAQTSISHNPAGSGEDLSRLAGKMLDYTNQARVAIKNGDHSKAMTFIHAAQHEYYTLQNIAPGAAMVPVYREFVSISILGPVSAEHQARKREEAKEAGHAVPVTAVQQVAGTYTHVMVSMPVARISLQDASSAAENGNWQAADAALSDVQEGVTTESVESDMPLARARENLILARAAVRHQQYQEAKASLQAACHALSSYAANGGQHARAARNLRQQIRSFAQDVQQQSISAVSKIDGWWKTTSSWSPYKTS